MRGSGGDLKRCRPSALAVEHSQRDDDEVVGRIHRNLRHERDTEPRPDKTQRGVDVGPADGDARLKPRLFAGGECGSAEWYPSRQRINRSSRRFRTKATAARPASRWCLGQGEDDLLIPRAVQRVYSRAYSGADEES